MELTRAYRRKRRGPIELTSLLDLLFTMVFISLIQQKEITQDAPPVPVAEVKEEKVIEVETPKVFNISATFNFYGTAHNPGLPEGSYIMQGSFDNESKLLRLGGVGWITRPPNYEMVPLSGTIDDSLSVFTGRIEALGCKTFTLKKESSLSTTPISTTPISGEWKGTYDCAQGMTGLTLTIQ